MSARTTTANGSGGLVAGVLNGDTALVFGDTLTISHVITGQTNLDIAGLVVANGGALTASGTVYVRSVPSGTLCEGSGALTCETLRVGAYHDPEVTVDTSGCAFSKCVLGSKFNKALDCVGAGNL